MSQCELVTILAHVNWLISKACMKINYIKQIGQDQQFPRTDGQSSSMFHHHMKTIQNSNKQTLPPL